MGHEWSLDVCIGYVHLHGIFPADEATHTHTIYNEIRAGNIDLPVTGLQEATKRKWHKDFLPREYKKAFSTAVAQGRARR